MKITLSPSLIFFKRLLCVHAEAHLVPQAPQPCNEVLVARVALLPLRLLQPKSGHGRPRALFCQRKAKEAMTGKWSDGCQALGKVS